MRHVIQDRVIDIEANFEVHGVDSRAWADNVASSRVAADNKMGTGLDWGVGKGQHDNASLDLCCAGPNAALQGVLFGIVGDAASIWRPE